MVTGERGAIIPPFPCWEDFVFDNGPKDIKENIERNSDTRAGEELVGTEELCSAKNKVQQIVVN